jgi:hypothetical protein
MYGEVKVLFFTLSSLQNHMKACIQIHERIALSQRNKPQICIEWEVGRVPQVRLNILENKNLASA